ncbi:MAG TPA: tannase/feruloyl esterase family alpha/beta hydrolase [Caulobacteraceae bacterium]|nr:tannase/feruloyl esterase family alpha/beta hydrolase [Caulobacteraceae bacterium]
MLGLKSTMQAAGLAATLAIALGAAQAHAATPCEEAAKAALPDGKVVSAELVDAGAVMAPTGATPADKAALAALPALCRVSAQLKPSADSLINIEVWLPTAGWNGKLVESGNGAFSPALPYGAMAAALQRGYAATASDTGHQDNSANFALGHPEKLIDFGYRAVHENAVAAKLIVAAYYTAGASKAYFQGCSTGGRQAYGEAQRYPADFDGIVAGDPGIRFVHQTGAELWTIKYIHDHPESLISKPKLKMLHDAVIAACDGLDGVKDGVIENPLRCKFDPIAIQCRHAEGPDCLTQAQVTLVRRLYAGTKDSKGRQVFPGLTRGSEVGWGNALIRTEPLEYGLDAFRLVAMQNPDWQFTSMDLDRDIPAADASVGPIVNNDDTNLKPFFARGGKLIGYHGGADPMTTAMSSVVYYQAVAARSGGSKALSNHYRLFLVPGMFHCVGGDGPSTFDMLSALDQWVETRTPPRSIPVALVRDGQVARTRPLCPFPQQAIYKGKGNTDQAQNFYCGIAGAGQGATPASKGAH